MVGLLHGAIEVISERYVEVPELRCKALQTVTQRPWCIYIIPEDDT